MITKERIKELITKRLQEISATGTGASTIPGEGIGVSAKMGFKRVNQKKLNDDAHGIEVKQLWTEDNSKFDIETYIAGLGIEDEDLKKFITKRLLDFDIIEDNLKTIIGRLKHAKLETQQTYKQDPSYTVLYSTDLIKSSLEDILTLLKANEDTSRTI